MKWQICTSDSSRHIVEAQKYLFSKYVPGEDINYLDLGCEDINSWTTNVLKRLDLQDEYTIFGLDDFLPIDHFVMPELPTEVVANDDIDGMMGPYPFDRIELGWGGSRKGLANKVSRFGQYLHNESYRVSCQFSIWRTEALVGALSIPRSPWQFEVNGELGGNVLGTLNPWRYIEESAISGRRPGKVNLCGLKKEDIDALVNGGLVGLENIVYGWKGTSARTRESYGTKYAKFY